jgi:hypothetical protein
VKRPQDMCGKCGKTLLGCRLNKRLNRPYWVAIHWTTREVTRG